MKTCTWVLEAASEGKYAVFCGKKISNFKMVRDEDKNLVRKFDDFYKQHQKESDHIPVEVSKD